MKKHNTDRGKLSKWQQRLARAQSVYDNFVKEMDQREAIYRGSKKLRKLVPGDEERLAEPAPHVRNVASELIESQVDSNIPQPKVTPLRAEDAQLAKLIEDMLRNELDRLPFEQMNDMMERTVPIQGGACFLVEWDNSQRTHTTVGDVVVSTLHPKQIVPQAGVNTSIAEMDYFFLKIPQTKEYIKRRYGVDVHDQGESEADIRSATTAEHADDMVTQYIAYYRNQSGGIGLYSWVNNVQLEDLEDYQARRLRVCTKCGAVEPLESEPLGAPAVEGLPPQAASMGAAGMDQVEVKPQSKPQGGGKVCPYCGNTKFAPGAKDYEEVFVPIVRAVGEPIPGANNQMQDTGQLDQLGQPIQIEVAVPTKIPYYKPDIYPVILQRSVSVFGQLLGDSDIDKIKDQQNTINRLEAKIIDKLLKSGSYMTIPAEARIDVDAEDMKVIRLQSAADKACLGVYDLQGDVSADMAYLNQVYEESRQTIGITDSFQGRVDRTATSGKAKEFAAAQSAGRLESKRVAKQAAYAALFEAIFKFKLAYADEPRPVVARDIHGNTEYQQFNRYDFLAQDEAGQWYWNDRFLFSCDTTAPLAANREAMWQETRLNLQTGAFGDPTQKQTLILFWQKMDMLHYPGAAETKAFLEEEYAREQQMAKMLQVIQKQEQELAAMQRQLQGQQGAGPTGEGSAVGPTGPGTAGNASSEPVPPQLLQQLDAQARAAAAADAGMMLAEGELPAEQ